MKVISCIEIPSREIRAGSRRKTPEINGTWKQYSGRKIFGLFPESSDQLLSIPAGNHLEKILNNFRLEYCFRFPLISRVFLREPAISPPLPCRFLQYPVTGMIVLGYSTDRYNARLSFEWCMN